MSCCSFCTEPAEVSCTAPVRKPILVLPPEIQVDDLYLSAADGKEWRVLKSEWGSWAFSDPVWLVYVEGRALPWQVCCFNMPVLVKRYLPCETPCCWKHYREISDGVYRCKDHWMIGTEEPLRANATNPEPEAVPEESANTKESTSKVKEHHKQDNRSSHKNWKRKVKPRNLERG